METNFDVTRDARLHQAADALLSAAMAYWQEYRRVTGGAAVIWVSDTDGRLVILTRGEYRETLFRNIDALKQDTQFLKPFEEPTS